MIIEIDAKVNIPDFWNVDFFNQIEFETRPMWHEGERTTASWYERYESVGINGKNPAGIKWNFLYDNLYYTQGYTEPPSVEGFHRNRWWVSKIDTGCMLPYHIDAQSDKWSQHMFDRGNKESLKKIASNLLPGDQEIILWIPLQDYKRGHILLYEDTLIDEYTAGKAYIFPKKEHAVANMSYEPKLSIVMMVVKNED